MPIFIVSLIIQVAFVVHVLKTGRNTMWIWIVVMLPLAGSLAYLVVELLPEIMGGRAGRNIKKNVGSIVNPNKALKGALQNYSVADTVANSAKLAEECLGKGMFEDAKGLYEKCLKGIHEYDPDFMYGLARAEFGLKNFNQVKTLLDQLIEKNPDYKNADAHLLYARSAEEMGDADLALREYTVLDGYYPGPEATCRYAILLKKVGRQDEARALFEKVINVSKASGRHYNSMHKEWVSLAKGEYRG